MAWQTPKTDWHGAIDSEGNYIGDRFNASDFNRIKNNLTYLRDLASRLYDEFSIVSLGEDRTPADYFYADEINQLEENLKTVNNGSLNRDYGNPPIYVDNGNVMDFRELNRLEGAILDLYDRLTNELRADGCSNGTWNEGRRTVMAWELLPVNYTDATWSGLKKYTQVDNDDGTVSFQDVTVYSNKDNSFFGAKEANRMNEALNTLMSMVENGTDLYTAFQNYFDTQKGLFEDTADATQEGFTSYVENLEAQGDTIIETIKTDYRNEITAFESQQEQLFTTWFEFIKNQLGEDVAGNLQNQIDALEVKTDGFDPRKTVFSSDGETITETYGTKKIETTFVSANKIVQKLFEGELLQKTKTITFSSDGLIINEEVQ